MTGDKMMVDAKSTGDPHRAAPGELGLVHAFLNTWHADGPRERWENPERMGDWLSKRGLIAIGTAVTPAGFAAVRGLRKGLRQLVGAADTDLAETRREALNRIARKAELVVEFDEDGRPRLVPVSTDIDGAMARILAVIAIAESEGTWSRLKLCRNAECQRVFYDTSKNHSAVWCSSQRCGNRMNARAYRARTQEGAD